MTLLDSASPITSLLGYTTLAASNSLSLVAMDTNLIDKATLIGNISLWSVNLSVLMDSIYQTQKQRPQRSTSASWYGVNPLIVFCTLAGIGFTSVLLLLLTDTPTPMTKATIVISVPFLSLFGTIMGAAAYGFVSQWSIWSLLRTATYPREENLPENSFSDNHTKAGQVIRISVTLQPIRDQSQQRNKNSEELPHPQNNSAKYQ